MRPLTTTHLPILPLLGVHRIALRQRSERERKREREREQQKAVKPSAATERLAVGERIRLMQDSQGQILVLS